MSARKVTLDVSRLPTVGFGHKDVAWWATAAFMVIEGTTIAIAGSSYLYLRKNFTIWPPPPTPLPELLVPTINVLLLLAVIVPMAFADRAARKLDVPRVKIGLVVATTMAAATLVLRWFEFEALNTRWDTHAYGSAAWATLGFHTTLLLVDFLETGAIAVLMFVGPIERKHMSDVSDSAFYQYFLSLSYVFVYILLFLSPRWI